MYNPDYLERPFIVVLNKIDLPEVCGTGFSFLFLNCFSVLVFRSLSECVKTVPIKCLIHKIFPIFMLRHMMIPLPGKG